jgi:hypothetical protein
MEYRHLVKENLSKKITAILADFAACLPFWQPLTHPHDWGRGLACYLLREEQQL